MKEYGPVLIQAAIGLIAWVYTRSAAKIKDLSDLKHNQILMSQSLKRAWQEIDKLKNQTPK